MTIKINKNSWHYRVLGHPFKSDLRYTNVGICKYFWMVVGSLLGWCGAGVLALAIVVTFVGWIPVGIGWLITGNLLSLEFFALSFGATTAVFLVWVGFTLKDLIKGKLRNRKKRPNILFEYVKAKKQRVCPLVEVVHDNS